jgi:hypothetical protein
MNATTDKKLTVFIVSYIFPPCTLTPANRIHSWAKYLGQHNIYPIIITRHWTDNVAEENYTLNKVDLPFKIERNELYEVHRLPYIGNYRTNHFGGKKNIFEKFVYNFEAAKEALLKYFNSNFLPYANLFAYTEQLAKTSKPDLLLITGNPFPLFKLGFKLKRQLQLKWIADYRDGWTTIGYKENKGPLTNIVYWLDTIFEKKWVSTANHFLTVSDSLKIGIEALTKTQGTVIFNGFFNDITLAPESVSENEITFLYSGAMYEKQDYRGLITIFKKIRQRYTNKIKIKFIFLGTTFLNDAFKNDIIFNNTQTFIELKDRVDYLTSLKIHNQADVFVMLSHAGMKGQTSSKIFDYLKFKKTILLYKNDNDVLEDILTKSKLGKIANNDEELEQIFVTLIEEKIINNAIQITSDDRYINSFSREEQAGLLAKVIKKVVVK